MDNLLQLENDLTFSSFNHEDAYLLGQILVQKIQKQKLKNIRMRIVLNHDIVFQYLMEGKHGDEWLNRKQKTVETFQHSSYYIWSCNEQTHQYDGYTKDSTYAICGGGFPIIVQNEIIGCAIVSGLAHGEDHQILVEALYELKKHKEEKEDTL